MKTNTIRNVILAVVIAAPIITFYRHNYCGVKPGQVWLFPGKPSVDPFAAWSPDTNTVLAVNGRYVQYSHTYPGNPPGTFTTSCDICWFKAGSALVKP